MKRHWIEYRQERPDCLMTFWVHHEVDGKPWFEADEFDPPRQAAYPGLGYPVYKVECDGFVFEFASLSELCVCIETLGTKLLPRTLDLSRARGTTMGPNSHWLSRLPARVKSWRYRQKAVAYLAVALKEFKESTASI